MRARALALAAVLAASSNAHAQTRATEVAVVRDGTTTFLSVKSDYEGPPEAFALVVPVPAAVGPDDVKTLPSEVFTRLGDLDAPRLVEYWEQDPCASYEEHAMSGHPHSRPSGRKTADDDGGTVEGQFTVGEYQVSIVTADAGTRALVATVKDVRATRSPLRIRYESPSFSVPSPLITGAQDVVVHVLAKGQRYEVANHANASIATNLDVDAAAKNDFAGAYAALFDDQSRGAVVTEYAWDARSCDPCPGLPLSQQDLATLGAGRGGYVLTRLHARDIKDGLVLRPAPPISGGREFRGGDGVLETGARVSLSNQFQARYAVRHPWTGAVSCDHPARGHWGGPPSGMQPPPIAGRGLAQAWRDPTKLALFPTMTLPAVATPTQTELAKPAPSVKPASSGCSQGESPEGSPLALLVPVALALRLRSKRTIGPRFPPRPHHRSHLLR